MSSFNNLDMPYSFRAFVEIKHTLKVLLCIALQFIAPVNIQPCLFLMSFYSLQAIASWL